MPRKVYVAWSGGLDSTWALWDLLKRNEGDWQIHAHHVRYVLRQDRFADDDRDGRQVGLDRAAAEADAIAAMRKWLYGEGYRFIYTESALDEGNYPSQGMGNFERVKFLLQILDQAFGEGADEHALIVFGANSKDYYTARGTGYEIKHLVAIASLAYPMILPPKLTLAGNAAMTREAMLADMPEALAALTMSCRRPKKILDRWQPCGAVRVFGDPEQWGETVKPCTCANMVGISARYRDGWDAPRGEEFLTYGGGGDA